MKIGIHCNQFDGRGTGKVPYDYAIGLQEYINAEIVFVTSQQSKNEGLVKIKEKFKVTLYDTKPIHFQTSEEQKHTKKILENIVAVEKIDLFHFIKSGENDNIDPANCKTGIHCVFSMNEPHGSVYAGVSEYLAKKFNKTDYIPHIIKYKSPTTDYRKKYNIPKDYFVVGRHGGYGQFNIPFVKDAVKAILDYRKDIFFLFLSTEPFIQHERVLYIPWVDNEQEIFNFINSCDVMLHAREDGETFGLSVGEFSVANKPVITWSGLFNGQKYQRYDICHIDLLNDRVLLYDDGQSLVDLLFNIDKSFVNEHNWDKYSNRFSSENVIKQYAQIFLK